MSLTKFFHSCTFCEILGELVEVPKLADKKRQCKNKPKENSSSDLASVAKKFVRYVEGKSYDIRDPIDTLQKMLLANGQDIISGVKGKLQSSFVFSVVSLIFQRHISNIVHAANRCIFSLSNVFCTRTHTY